MDEPTLDTSSPSPVKQPSQWIMAATCSALVMITTLGGIFAMRERLMEDAQHSVQSQKEAMDGLEQRMERMQSSISTLENAPKLDPDTVTSIKSDLGDMKSGIEALQKREESIETRIKALEDAVAAKKEEVAKASARADSVTATELRMIALSGKPYLEQWSSWSTKHPGSSSKYAHLPIFAATGIPLESEMRSNLRSLLKDIKLPPKVDDTSVIGKINMHLHGLVSIKKSGDSDALTKLRTTAEREDLDTAASAVEASGVMEDSKALSEWYKQYRDRKQALEELATVESTAEPTHD